MIDAKNVFGQPVTNDIRNYNIRKIVTSQGDEYTTCCLLHYVHFKKNYCKMVAKDLSKQLALDAYLKEIPQINFTESLDQTGNIFFIIEEAKETMLDF